YEAQLAAGMAKRKAFQDQVYDPPIKAKPGDYGVDRDGNDWAMTTAGEIRINGDTTWRYNNPGNILPGFRRHWSMGGVSSINIQQPSGLAMFASEAEGWQALRNLLNLGGGARGRYRDQTVGTFTQDYLGVALGGKSAFGDDPQAYTQRVQGGTG